MDINGILNDNQSGSTDLARRGLELYRHIVEESLQKGQAAVDLFNQLQDTIKKLIKAQPNMVLIRRTGTNLQAYFKRLEKMDEIPEDVHNQLLRKIDQLQQEITQNVDKISAMGAKIIAPGNKIMLHSRSGLVEKILLTANDMKRRYELFQLKSHPPDEGVAFAESFAKKGVKTTLIADAQMGVFMPDMNLVLIGADRLYENGIVNKAGTLPLCLTARHYGVPVYLAVETGKILKESERSIKFLPKDTEEVYKGKQKKLGVENIYFEKIPFDLIHKVISEQGMFETFEFINWYLKE